MLQKFKLNWKTTIAGLTSGIPVLFVGIQEKDITKICAGLGLIFGGILAADAKSKKAAELAKQEAETDPKN